MPDNNPYTLKEEQSSAINEIYEKFNNNINPICSLPTGKGKTIIVCNIIRDTIKQGYIQILIVVRANNLVDPWITELNKFQIKYELIHGKDRHEKIINEKYEIRKGDVILTSHNTATLDIEYILKIGRFDLLIIDEIHSFINSKKITQMFKEFVKINATRKLFLSATPIQNRKEDLGLINILLNNPEVLKHKPDELNKEILDSAYKDALDKKNYYTTANHKS